MDLKAFKFPKLTPVDMAISTLETDKKLLAEATERGFYNGNTPYNDLFSQAFFSGGQVVFKEGLDDEFKQDAWNYCRALMRSFQPKHEEKEAVCAMLMSELLEPKMAGE